MAWLAALTAAEVVAEGSFPAAVLLATGKAAIARAVICGPLASPCPRVQARLIWLLPLAAVLAAVLAAHVERPASRMPGPRGTGA